MRVEGVKEAMQRLEQAGQQLRAALHRALDKSGAMVAGQARRIVYLGHPEHLNQGTQPGGRLRSSIIYEVEGTQARIGTNVEYAAIHEFGGHTGPRVIRPVNAKALRFEIDGNVVFAAFVNHPGSNIPARPYLQPALDSQQENIQAAFDEAVRGVLP